MDILRLSATFGRLKGQELTPQKGLNVIYAPNESGKSTWGAFLRAMLYGLSTRERGPMADKNRFAPWDGGGMQGRMDFDSHLGRCTMTRTTRRAAAPMGEFACVYENTATPVPEITAQNAGETLLGVPREVFERSAFIGQNALAVEQDAELERRIAALITTGDEDTSYTETYERLKRQLNRRKHNKTGLIPTLEREMDALRLSLRELDDLQAQSVQVQETVTALERRTNELRRWQQQWQSLERQQRLDTYHNAAQTADEAARRAALLAETAGDVPEGETLALLEGQAAALRQDLTALAQQHQEAEDARQAAADKQAALTGHPLYPATEPELQTRLENIRVPKKPSFALPIADGLLVVIAAVLAVVFRGQSPQQWIFCGIGLLGLAALVLAVALRKRLIVENENLTARGKAKLEAQMAEYLPLYKETAEVQAAAARLADGYAAAEDNCRRRLTALVSQTRQFEPAVNDLSGVETALRGLRRQAASLDAARRQAREAALYRDALEGHLPEGQTDDTLAQLPPPPLSKQETEAELLRLQGRLSAEKSRLDTLTGRIRSLDRSSDLEEQLHQKEEQLAALQGEYDALALAMEVLSDANTVLQNRFSPALGGRAAEIFAAITGGRYDKVLLSRDFSLSAEAAGDPVGRSVRLLSQGAADQLYLAVRLAICDMVLPPENRVPLVLDDALVSFDDDRLHAALDYLLEESQKRQILLFTCQKREGDYLQGCENVTLLTL